ncbi:MAG: hypothetical protein UY63_C0017G0009 [Parcubacteria group bacterium GW2011_GWA2_51_10]|nr:MAG: hypothetical protein UY63_C0017G0009 [Parcubacteria group bacterium GW2011_GWA2_51_10]
MKKYLILVFILYILLQAPSVINADEKIPAGFPAQSIWTSQASAVEGETIDVYAAIHNGSAESIKGNVTFSVDGKSIGSKSFEISAGKSELVSIAWKTVAGTHIIRANIESESGVKNDQSGDLSITISNAPAPTQLEQGAQVVSEAAAKIASASAPAVASVAQNIIQGAEAFRQSGIAYAQRNMESAENEGVKQDDASPDTPAGQKESVATKEVPGSVAGAKTSGEAQNSVFAKLSQLAAPAILFSFGNRAIFYPLLSLLALVILFVLGRMVRRPQL